MDEFKARGFENKTDEEPCAVLSTIPLDTSEGVLMGESWGYGIQAES